MNWMIIVQLEIFLPHATSSLSAEDMLALLPLTTFCVERKQIVEVHNLQLCSQRQDKRVLAPLQEMVTTSHPYSAIHIQC